MLLKFKNKRFANSLKAVSPERVFLLTGYHTKMNTMKLENHFSALPALSVSGIFVAAIAAAIIIISIIISVIIITPPGTV